MAEIINSNTKSHKSNELIRKMCEKALGREVSSFSVKELAGGLCNAVYLTECDDVRMVLKIASPDDVVTMRHEKDYIKVEALMLEKFEKELNIPAPKLILFDESRTLCSEPYFFMSFVDGVALGTMEVRPDKEQYGRIKYELGKICSQISSLKSEWFGIPMLEETYTKSNCDFMLIMFTMLLNDISDKGQSIPYITDRKLLGLIEKCRFSLDEVKEAVYVHTDTWDGNVMIKENKLCALVDFAAVLYGDKLLTHDFHDFTPVPDENFCKGFGKTTFTDNEKIRLTVYKIWQRLGMIAECAFREYKSPDQYSWVWGEFEKAVIELENMIK